MKHALASVALLALAMGCDATGGATSEDPGNSTTSHATTTHETGSTGMPDGGSEDGGSEDGGSEDGASADGDSASVTGATGNGFEANWGNAAAITNGAASGNGTGGQGSFGGSGGESGSDGNHGIGGEAGAPNYPEDPYPALVMTRAQRQALLDGGTSGGTTGATEDGADDMWVIIADTELVCTEYLFPACGGHWQLDFVLPRSMQQVGTYELEWLSYSYADEAEDPDLPDICGLGGGTEFSDGSIVEVLEISASEVRFRLHSDPWFIDDEVNGIYTVPRCPQ